MVATRDPEHISQVRNRWWTLFLVLFLADLLLIPMGLPVGTEAVASYALTYFTPMYFAFGGAVLLAIRLNGIERRFWGLMATVVGLLLIPETYWVWYETFVDFRGPQIPNWIELGHLGAMACFWGLLISMTTFGEAPIVTRLRFYLDVLGGVIVAFALVYWWWTLPMFANLPMGRWPVAAVAAMYPVCGVLFLLTTLLIALGWKLYRWRPWERLISAAFALYGAGLLTFPVMYRDWITKPVQRGIDWYTILLGFGIYMLFMAAVYRATSDSESVRAEQWSVPGTGFVSLSMVYPSLLAFAMLLLGGLALRVAGAPGGFVLVVAAALLAFVLIVRSWLSSVELAHHRAQSITDPVTGAFNQRYLYDRLGRDLAQAGRSGSTVAAMAFDIVDFRNIVGMCGPDEADRVLAEFTGILRREAPEAATTYRVGRDEFVVAVPEFSADESATLAHRVCARAASSITVDGIPIALSAGVAVFPTDAADAALLVSRALAAQQLAHAAERTDVVVYDAEVVDAADPLVRLERARRRLHRTKLRVLAAATDARDAHTRYHSESVAEIASAFALVLELTPDQTLVLETAARVLDIGMIGIPDEVALKPGSLTEAEMAIVEQHPVFGERLLAPADMPEVLPVVRHHHERWDGTGYPDRLIGADTPFEARILAICDAFEAMTSSRSFRPALSTAKALAEIERCAGTQFDPQLAAVFCRMVVRMHGRELSERLAEGRREANRA